MAEKQAAEARLRLLQGQIEPHFLFNTLANVVAPIDHDAAKAKRMLETFTDDLRSSLASLRRKYSTLGSELDLVQTYLDLLKARMEDRLQFSIEGRRAARCPFAAAAAAAGGERHSPWARTQARRWPREGSRCTR